jgi:uncharacterized protein (DUF302 family)
MNTKSFKTLEKINFYKWLGLLLLLPLTANAEELPETIKSAPTETVPEVNAGMTASKPLIYDRTVQGKMEEVYSKVFTALDNNSYYVILEPNLGKNLSLFAKRWGEDYNKNKLESIRSIVFCSAWYANKISNVDPSLLALCPLRITLYSKENETHILFVRPGRVAGNSPAQLIAKELEDDVIRTIEVAISN